MSASGRPNEQQPLEELFGSVFDLAGQVTARISQDAIEARLRRVLREASRARARPAGAASDPVLAALVSRAAARDQDAWDRIVERYAPLVYSVCLRHRLDDQDVEDVGQRVWLLLLEQIGTLREPAALPGWLATTTTRECLRVLRKARQPGPLGVWPADPAWFAGRAAVDAELLAAERSAALHAAIAELPPRCQQLLSMLLSDPPCSYPEISAALGIPVGSIGPQRTRCLDRLRRSMALAALQEDPGEPDPGDQVPGP